MNPGLQPTEMPKLVESPTPKPEPTKNNKKLILVITIMVLLIIAGAAAYWWRDKTANDVTNKQNASIVALNAEVTKLKAGSTSTTQSSPDLTDADKNNAVTIVNDFYSKYNALINNDGQAQKDAVTNNHPYSLSVSEKTLIAQYSTDKFMASYFKNSLTKLLPGGDDIMCASNSESKDPYVVNPDIANNIIQMGIISFKTEHISVNVAKESGKLKIDSIVCK
jgi:hypothetical protein